MTYYISRQVAMSFDEAVHATRNALLRQGFAIITHIDMQAALQKHLGVDFPRYLILGACNPQLTYRALQAEDKIGTMLPCNVVLQQQDSANTEISAVDPVAAMRTINNVVLEQIAQDIRSRLQAVIEEVVRTAQAT